MAKLVLCDEYPLSRESLSCMLSRWPGVEFAAAVGETGRVAASLDEHNPDAVIVVAHGAADPVAFTMIHDVRRRAPRCGVVLVVSRRSPVMTVAAWEAGVTSVVDLRSETDVLQSAVRDAAAGLRRMSALEVDEARVHLEAMGMEHWSSIDATARTILACLADGMSDTQIADQVGLSVQTVRNRVSRLLDDFAMSNRTQLAVALTKAHRNPGCKQELFAGPCGDRCRLVDGDAFGR